MIHISALSTKDLSAGQRVSRKYRRAYMRKLRRREYSKLKGIVPSVSKKEKVSKVTVIEEAIKYIDELHQALATRLQSKGFAVPDTMDPTTVVNFVRNMVPFCTLKPCDVICEKQQRVASYLCKPDRKVKRLS